MNIQVERIKVEKYRSRYSILLIICVLAPFILVSYQLFSSLNQNLLIPFIIFVIIILILFGVRYEIVDRYLVFRTWWIKNGEVDIQSFEKIERTYFVLASNAFSLKRLGIRLKKGSKYPFLLISPVEELKFIERLKQINPLIEIEVENKRGWYRFWDWDI